MNKKLMMLLAACGLCVSFASAGPRGKDGKEDKEDFPKFEEVTKDMEVKEGFFTLYFDKKDDKLLARIPKGMLGEPFLMSMSIPKGPQYAGWMIGSDAVYLERMDKKLVLMAADSRYMEGKGSTVEDVINRTYTDTIIESVDIKTEAGGDPVIDLGDLMKKDLVGLGEAYGNRRMDPSLSRWSTMKAFPDNVEVAVDGAFMSRGPGSDGLIASLHLSLSKLPKNGYEPREADDRVGYFMTARKDWSADHKEKTVFKRYIHRWNLEKQDPKAAESPVKEPIIFYIEKTVPVKYRRYVREGILEWNRAYEKIGLLDAVQVRQQTDTNEFADLDPEDVRYNFIRWIVSGRAFARGPSHVNPFTGQILDADIIFDDSMVRFYVYEYDLLGPNAFDMHADPVKEEFFANFPEYKYESFDERITPNFSQGLHLHSESEIIEPSEFLRMRGQQQTCELAAGMVHQLAFSQLQAIQNGKRDLPEEFIGQVIREIVAHEVGHTLGLRHNFKGSTWLKLSEITSASSDTRALTGSVMDYNPSEYAEAEIEQGDFVSQIIGPYDEWVIEYGYRPFMSGGEAKSEAEMLKSITARVAEDGLDYATDEDTSDFGPDPYSYRYDNGQDPVTYAKHRMALARRLMPELVERGVEEGDSYSRLRRAFAIVTNEYAFSSRIAARMVGGQKMHRDHKGDPDARTPIEVVPVEKQREALDFLGETVFSDEFYDFPTEVTTRLAPGRFLHWDSDQMDFNIDYNVHDRVLGIQSRVLTLLVNPIVMNRIYDSELKVPADEDAMTVPELMNTLTTTIWSELDGGSSKKWTNRKPMISSTRRNLQREYLNRLVRIMLTEPGRGLNADAYAVVRMTVKDLGEQIGTVMDKSGDKLDAYTMAHLDEAKHRIDKVLEAEFTDGASAGSSARGGRRAIEGAGIDRR